MCTLGHDVIVFILYGKTLATLPSVNTDYMVLGLGLKVFSRTWKILKPSILKTRINLTCGREESDRRKNICAF